MKTQRGPLKDKIFKTESFDAVIPNTKEILVKLDYALTLCSPAMDENDACSKTEYTDGSNPMLLSQPKTANFLQLWIKDNPVLNTEIDNCNKSIRGHLLSFQKMNYDTLSFDQKLILTKQKKIFGVIVDSLFDIKSLIRFVSSQDSAYSDNLGEVMGILKIDCKYNIRERMIDLKSKSFILPLDRNNGAKSRIKAELNIESSQVRHQSKKVKKFIEIIQRNSGTGLTPKEHLEKITNTMERFRRVKTPCEQERSYRGFNIDKKTSKESAMAKDILNGNNFTQKKNRFHSTHRSKERTKELLNTYKNGLNNEFRVLKNMHGSVFSKPVIINKFSDKKITRISERKDFLSEAPRIDMLSKDSKRVQKLHYYRKYINRDNPMISKQSQKSSSKQLLTQDCNDEVAPESKS